MENFTIYQKAESRKPKAKSQEPRAKSREPRAVLILDLFDFSLDLVVLPMCCRCIPALRGPRREPPCIDGWMGDGWMDGWVGKYLFLFCLLLENYLIYDANSFHAP